MLSRATLWMWSIVAGVALIAGYFLVRRASAAGSATDLYYAGVSLLATLGIGAGILVHRPARPLPWVLLTVAQLTYTTGDVTYYIASITGHDTFPGVADVFYLAQFPLMVAALAVFIRRRTPGWHTPTWIDAAVLGTAAALLWWVYVISPVAAGSDLSAAALAVTVAYPVLDLLMLATALRLMIGGGVRPIAFQLLVASLAAMLLGDTAYTIEAAQSYWDSGGLLDSIWLSSYVLGAASALHPSMRTLDARAHVQTPASTPRRLAVLATASILGPIVLFVQYLRGSSGHEPVIAIACMLTFLLVLARMAGLVSAQRLTAITDGLTRLRTRGHFTEVLRVESERARRANQPIGLIIVDADHFKHINDTWGHPAGDDVLVEIAERLKAVSHAPDTVARYGGEEFAILVPGAGDAEIEALGERIRLTIGDRPIRVNRDRELPVTVSVGAVSLSGDQADPERLVRAADQALYAAKREGRNLVRSLAPA